ncbi:MAG: ABC transporter permease [Haloarculaceae archaeon]
MATEGVDQVRDGATDGERDRERSLPLVLASAAVAAAVLSPLLWLVLRAADVGVGGAVDILTRPSSVDILLNSLALVALVTVASVALGVPLAVLTVQTDLPFRRFWTVVLALPLVIPSYIGAFAYVSAPGALADALAPLGVDSVPTIYGLPGAAFVLTLYIYPYVFITTRAALLSMDATLVEAARTLNHSRVSAFRRVTLPRVLPAVAAGGLLVALYTLSDFGTPAIMRVDVFTRSIYVAYNTFARDVAALLSLQLLAVTAVILAVERRVGSATRADTAHATRSAGRGSVQMRLGAWTLPALALCTTVAVLALVVPLGVLLLWLGRASPGYAGGFQFSWVYGLNSVYVSTLAALVAVVAALPVAYLSARSRSPLATLFDRATYVGYAVPGVVLGLALVYFGSSVASFVYQTVPLLVFAYVVRFLPQAVGATRSSVLQVDPKLVEAARSLGESSLGSFRRVTLPLIWPGVAAGAALVFLTTMKELPATLLLQPTGSTFVARLVGGTSPTGFDTLVTYIWLVQEAGHYGQAAVPALVLVGVSAVSMLVILARERYDV